MRTIIGFTIDSSPSRLLDDGFCSEQNLARHIASRAQIVGSRVSGPHFLATGWDLCVTFGKTEFWLLFKKQGDMYLLRIDSVWDLRSLFSINHNPDYSRFIHEVKDWLQTAHLGQIIFDNECAM